MQFIPALTSFIASLTLKPALFNSSSYRDAASTEKIFETFYINRVMKTTFTTSHLNSFF